MKYLAIIVYVEIGTNLWSESSYRLKDYKTFRLSKTKFSLYLINLTKLKKIIISVNLFRI